MKKLFFQGVTMALFFLGTWFFLSQIDWVKFFMLEEASDKTEQVLGELFLDVFEQSATEIQNPEVEEIIDRMVSEICKANQIDKERIKVHVIEKEEINAFALPDGHLIIYTGLILNSENQEELAGVICHEIAHIQLNHVMKKLVKEIGLSVLISISTGGTGAEVTKQAAKTLSSSAFDRSLEKDADLKAIDYLANAKVNPKPFADFLYKLSYDKNGGIPNLTWLETHPDSKERAEYILENSEGRLSDFKPIVSNQDWEKLKDLLKEN